VIKNHISSCWSTLRSKSCSRRWNCSQHVETRKDKLRLKFSKLLSD